MPAIKIFPQLTNVIAKSHTRSHAITSTLDHTSNGIEGQLLMQEADRIDWKDTPQIVKGLKYITSLAHAGYTGSHDVAVKDKYAYACGYINDALYVIDISDPTSPSIVVTFTDAVLGRLDGIHDIAIDGDYAYVTCINRNSIVSIDISTPASPSIIGELIDATKLATVHALILREGYIYAGAFGGDYFNIIDISDPADMSIIGYVQHATYLDGARGIYVRSDYAYVVTRDTGYLTVVDISNKASPSITGQLQVCSTAAPCLQNIDVRGDYAFITNHGDSEMTVVDISDPSSLVEVGSIPIVKPNYIKLYGDYALVTSTASATTSALNIINIKDPENPLLVISLVHNDLNYACGFTIFRNYVLISPRDLTNKVLTILQLREDTIVLARANLITADQVNIPDTYQVRVELNSIASPGFDLNNNFHFELWASGNATSYLANKLKDTNASFDSKMLSAKVKNTTDGTEAYILNVDSATQLTLTSDIFNDGNEAYTINHAEFQAPVSGYYEIFGSIEWRFDSVVADKRYIGQIFQNSATILFGMGTHSSLVNAINNNPCGLAHLAAGAYITLVARLYAGVSTVDIRCYPAGSTYLEVRLLQQD